MEVESRFLVIVKGIAEGVKGQHKGKIGRRHT
jgi:hypothetical protein